jgi:DNA repair protein SbcC/Rad50
MLSYDYIIEREVSEGKTQRFLPGIIPKKLDALVSIEGPNSSGKSTLLNIIALGLYGTKNQRINTTLQTKMHSLLDSNHQKLKFNFTLTSKNNELVLKSEKGELGGSEISVKECTDGITYRPISPENFGKKYNLIYDIPNNPTERLSELLKELKDEQFQYGNRFKEFGFFLHDIIGKISAARDLKRLEDVKAKLKEARDQKENLKTEIPELESFLRDLERSSYIRFYFYYCNECERLKQEENLAQEKVEKFAKDGKKLTHQLTHERSKLSALQSQLIQKYGTVTPLIEGLMRSQPRNEKVRFRNWKEINPYHVETVDLSTIKLEAVHYIDLFSVEIEKMQNEPAFKDASMLEKILESLQEFEDSGLLIPKLQVTLGDFVRIIKEESKKSSILVKKYENVDDIVRILNELCNLAAEIQESMEKIKKESVATRDLSENGANTFFGEKDELRAIQKNLELMCAKRNGYLNRCVDKGIDEKTLSRPFNEIKDFIPKNPVLEQYLSLNESQTMSKIVELSQDIIEKKRDLQSCNLVITINEKDEQRLDQLKPHKYEKYHDLLTSFLKTTDAISSKLLGNYTNYLNSLIKKDVKEEDLITDKDRADYYQEISKYLAYRIGTFRHIDRMYKAKIVNLVSGIISTDDGTIIHIADMGTGQSQSAYLLSLLNVKDDNRKIIALFDEIAMMDESSLEPICLKLKELYEDNRLLLGIMVQRGNNLNIRSL